jgi:hypothetical protein
MLTIPTAALLQAWERGHDASPGQRGLILLALAHPDVPVAALESWPVGQRDAALLGLFASLYGGRLAAQAECPQCSAALEMDIPVATIAAPAPRLTANRFVLEHGGYRLTYRLPTTGDLAALTGPVVASRDEAMGKWLLRRCLLDVSGPDDARSRHSDGPEPQEMEAAGLASTQEIPDEVTGALEASIAATASSLDPLAEIELKLDCPECAFSWQSPFDIVSFLWSELDAWARRMLREIHILASYYGWSEADIIALSPQRRLRYRELIGT